MSADRATGTERRHVAGQAHSATSQHTPAGQHAEPDVGLQPQPRIRAQEGRPGGGPGTSRAPGGAATGGAATRRRGLRSCGGGR